jgi:hypothetical protein
MRKPKPNDYVYKVTRTRPKPEYYQSRVQTKLVSHRSVRAMLKSQPRVDTFQVQRALIGEWEDIDLSELEQ